MSLLSSIKLAANMPAAHATTYRPDNHSTKLSRTLAVLKYSAMQCEEETGGLKRTVMTTSPGMEILNRIWENR